MCLNLRIKRGFNLLKKKKLVTWRVRMVGVKHIFCANPDSTYSFKKIKSNRG